MWLIGAGQLLPHDITVFLLSLAALLGLARLLGEVAGRYGQPMVLGEILAGVILGPTVLGALAPSASAWLFPAEGAVPVTMDGFVMIAATLLLFVVGLDVDLSTVRRQGKATLIVSASGMLLPFTIGFTLACLIPEVLGYGTRAAPVPFAIFVGIAMSITALPVIAKILMDLNLAKSDMGMLVLSSAMLDDLVGWIGFAMVLAMLPGAGSNSVLEHALDKAFQQPSVPITIIATILFLVLMLTVGRWLCHRALPWVQAHWSWPGGVLGFVSVIALLCGAFTEYLGVHSIFGAFIAGVAVGDSHHLRERTRDTIHQFVTNIFAPIFFASIGLRINFVTNFNLAVVAIVFAAACTGKITGCYFGARASKMSPRESWAIGFGMATQGVVGIILGQLAREANLINDQLLVAIVIMALTTSLISGPAMQKILRTKHRRRLKDLLTDRNILTQLKSATVPGVVGELVQRAAELTGLDARTTTHAVLQRERIMSTGLPHGLAVPHARLDQLTKPCLILGRNPEGVDFDAPDGQPARIICLILTPTSQPDSQIEILGIIARTFKDADTRQRLLSMGSSTEFLAVLNLADSHAADSAAATVA
jgi:Kef-type K+ transport system membrane component KefB